MYGEEVDITLCKNKKHVEQELVERFHEELYAFTDAVENIILDTLLENKKYNVTDRRQLSAAMCTGLSELTACLNIGLMIRKENER